MPASGLSQGSAGNGGGSGFAVGVAVECTVAGGLATLDWVDTHELPHSITTIAGKYKNRFCFIR